MNYCPGLHFVESLGHPGLPLEWENNSFTSPKRPDGVSAAGRCKKTGAETQEKNDLRHVP